MFNFFVYIFNFFYRKFKKIMKFFIVLFILFILLNLFNNIVYGASEGEILTDGSTSQVIVPTQDMFAALDTAYNNAEVSFLSYLEKLYNSGSTNIITTFMNYVSDGFFVYYEYPTTGIIRVWLYKASSTYTNTTLQEPTYGIYAFSSLPGYVLTPSNHAICFFEYYVYNNTCTNLLVQTNGSLSIPSYLYLKRTNLLMEFLNKYKFNNINNNYNSVLEEIKTDINEQTNAINEQTNSINNLTNTVTDSNVEDSSIDLPTDNSNDITKDGLDGIFTSMYNAFCTGTAQDIVFPIPFTDKNISLPANYVRQMLSNNGGSWVITLIEAFWWYLISRFIIKDIANKVTKIKSGNIEDIETSNIKGDML